MWCAELPPTFFISQGVRVEFSEDVMRAVEQVQRLQHDRLLQLYGAVLMRQHQLRADRKDMAARARLRSRARRSSADGRGTRRRAEEHCHRVLLRRCPDLAGLPPTFELG